MAKPTQATRVLDSLYRAGERGITQGDWLTVSGLDGRGRITRVAARVKELRNEGFEIEVAGERFGFAIYRIAADGRLFAVAA